MENSFESFYCNGNDKIFFCSLIERSVKIRDLNVKYLQNGRSKSNYKLNEETFLLDKECYVYFRNAVIKSLKEDVTVTFLKQSSCSGMQINMEVIICPIYKEKKECMVSMRSLTKEMDISSKQDNFNSKKSCHTYDTSKNMEDIKVDCNKSRKWGQFTKREEEILMLIAKGWTNKYIARYLGICEGTVKKTVYNIYKKMGFSSRSDAILYVLMSDKNSVNERGIYK